MSSIKKAIDKENENKKISKFSTFYKQFWIRDAYLRSYIYVLLAENM